MTLDEALEILRKLSGEIIDYYLSVSCPCAFPRYRFVVGFDGTKYSEGLVHTFDTNIFVLASVDPKKGFLVPRKGNEYACRVCGSTYQYSHKEYSIVFEKVALSSKNIVSEQIGAAANPPFPLFGGIYLVNGAWTQEQYKHESLRLFQDFPHPTSEEFKQWMIERA